MGQFINPSRSSGPGWGRRVGMGFANMLSSLGESIPKIAQEYEDDEDKQIVREYLAEAKKKIDARHGQEYTDSIASMPGQFQDKYPTLGKVDELGAEPTSQPVNMLRPQEEAMGQEVPQEPNPYGVSLLGRGAEIQPDLSVKKPMDSLEIQLLDGVTRRFREQLMKSRPEQMKNPPMVEGKTKNAEVSSATSGTSVGDSGFTPEGTNQIRMGRLDTTDPQAMASRVDQSARKSFQFDPMLYDILSSGMDAAAKMHNPKLGLTMLENLLTLAQKEGDIDVREALAYARGLRDLDNENKTLWVEAVKLAKDTGEQPDVVFKQLKAGYQGSGGPSADGTKPIKLPPPKGAVTPLARFMKEPKPPTALDKIKSLREKKNSLIMEWEKTTDIASKLTPNSRARKEFEKKISQIDIQIKELEKIAEIPSGEETNKEEVNSDVDARIDELVRQGKTNEEIEDILQSEQ
jgi:hypothetical protein